MPQAQALRCSTYGACGWAVVAPGTEVLTWTWPGDQYGEIGLIIIGPGGEIAYSSGTYLADGSGPYGDGLLADDGYGFVDVGLLPVAICAQ